MIMKKQDPEIQIDKDVELPVVGNGTLRRGPQPKYPFRDLEVGDSFKAPEQSRNEVMRLRQSMNAFNSQARMEASRAEPPAEPVTMTLAQDKKGDWRVWRVK